MQKKNITLSIALAVRNEEKNIRSCLESIQDIAHEIIIVDGGSTDRTIEIAKSFDANIIETDNPPIFHINKQKAMDACKGEWILQLDADEVVTQELKKEIVNIIDEEPRTKNQELRTKNGYYIPRRNYFWGHFMKKGGQYPDYVIRLVRNGYARFPCKSVHEQIEIIGDIGYLHNPLLHYSYKTKEDYWKKADAYTTLTALELKKQYVDISFSSWFFYVVWKPMYMFFSLFIRHKGFMDGWYGLVFAYWSALHYPIAYNKYKTMI